MSKTSCFFDGSHMSSFDFSILVIDYAISRGFEINREQYDVDVEAYNNDGLDEDTLTDVLHALDWTYEDALEYLNSLDSSAGFAWYVDDNSLFREEFEND